jgi:hypothetical protein
MPATNWEIPKSANSGAKCDSWPLPESLLRNYTALLVKGLGKPPSSCKVHCATFLPSLRLAHDHTTANFLSLTDHHILSSRVPLLQNPQDRSKGTREWHKMLPESLLHTIYALLAKGLGKSKI